jgi:hypothetical protein
MESAKEAKLFLGNYLPFAIRTGFSRPEGKRFGLEKIANG